MQRSLHKQEDGGRKERFIRVLLACAVLLIPGMVRAQYNCTPTYTGMVPLTDLGTGEYQGFQGGLYPDGQNACPEEHYAAGLAIAEEIEPLNAAGEPDANGKIVFASIGMSNTAQEFQPFIDKALAEPELNSKVVMVNGAHAGQHVGKWQNPDGSGWSFFNDALSAAGVTAEQVQVVWILLAARSDVGPQTFPEHAVGLAEGVRATVQNLKDLYPNVRIAYLSSRIFAGYATIDLSPEPFAYEGGFSMKWVIEDQINGDADLAFEGANAEAPWLTWGPYLWADGVGSDGAPGGVPGRSDGLEWLCEDFFGTGKNDGVHPSVSGAEKVGGMLLEFFMNEPTALPWFMPGRTPSSVELSSFTARVEGSDVLLNWSTAREANHRGFEIQRQRGTGAFETIGFVEGRGNGSSGTDYAFRDRNLPPGGYAYRLKHVDINGSAEFSSDITVTIHAPKQFALDPGYPNPFRGSTTLFYQLPERAFVTLKVYNLLGQEVAELVAREVPEGPHSVRWDGLDRQGRPVVPGVYFVTLWRQTPSGGAELVARQKLLRVR